MTTDTCRHCGLPIIESGHGWTHNHGLRRCRQPDDVTVYGYEALPDDGEPCECWACTKLGPAVRVPVDPSEYG